MNRCKELVEKTGKRNRQRKRNEQRKTVHDTRGTMNRKGGRTNNNKRKKGQQGQANEKKTT